MRLSRSSVDIGGAAMPAIPGMPGMPGIDFLKQAADLRPQTVRIMLTGYTDAGTLVEAINSSVVYKYVTKPWINEDLAATVKRALQHYETMKGQRQLQLHNERLQSSLAAARDAFIEVLMQRLDAKDSFARGHADLLRWEEQQGLAAPQTPASAAVPGKAPAAAAQGRKP